MDELVAAAELVGSGLKQGRQIPFGVGEAVGKREAIIGLDALHSDSPALVPLDEADQEISGGVS